MAELTTTMRQAFSARSFTDQDVSNSEVAELIEVARFSPSGGNRQGQKVVVIRSAETKKQLFELSKPMLRVYLTQVAAGEAPLNTINPTTIDVEAAKVDESIDLSRFEGISRAPVNLVIGVDLGVVASMDQWHERIGVISGASVYPFCHNILLAARDRGLGSGITTFLAGQEPEVQKLLGFPSHVAVAALMAIGHPTKLLTRLSRKPVDELARLERWEGGTPLPGPTPDGVSA